MQTGGRGVMPKKVKKSLGRTEGERLVQLHHRAQAEEEMSKKKEEMLALFLKVKRLLLKSFQSSSGQSGTVSERAIRG